MYASCGNVHADGSVARVRGVDKEFWKKTMDPGMETARECSVARKIDMDMITTGRSSADRANEESLNTSLKELLAERRGTRMAVSDVRRQLTESINTTLQNEEVVDALRRMEADGFIQLNERAQTVFVRAGVAT